VAAEQLAPWKDSGMQDAWRAYLELALGLTEASRKRAQNVARKLVGQSGATAAQLQGLAEDLLAAGVANREALTRIVRVEVDRALAAVGLASVEEVAALTDRVARLERQLRAAESTAGAGSATRPTAGPAAGVAQIAPVPATNAVAKKAAKKAAAKKAAAGPAVAKKAATGSAVAKKAVAGAGIEPAEDAAATTPAADRAVAKKAVAKKAVAKKAVAKKAVAKRTGATVTSTDQTGRAASASPAPADPRIAP
jgi:polyhydroxyalkanoate synthesis regulator phasin